MKVTVIGTKNYLQENMQKLSQEGFKKIFESINLYGIKKSVDKRGIDKFIIHCARLAAGTGALSGSGGALTMVLGIPIDAVNTITQQFRVTLGIIYHKRGTYQVSFEEFMAIVATSVKVDAGVAITKTVMEEVAERLLVKLGFKAAGRLIPVVGAAIGGITNYMFIKRIGKEVKLMNFEAPQIF